VEEEKEIGSAICRAGIICLTAAILAGVSVSNLDSTSLPAAALVVLAQHVRDGVPHPASDG
jgi:hypothetical protein